MPTDREDFERRLLALVRDYMDEADELYPEEYLIGDFMVLFEVFTRIPDDEQLPAWSGGLRAGWESPQVALSSTNSVYWLDEVWLVEALARARERRREARESRETDADEADE